jgi:hypothetical protein
MMEIPYQTEDPNYFPCIESITAATLGEVFNRVTAKIFRRFSIVVECLACPEREHQTIGGPFAHPLALTSEFARLPHRDPRHLPNQRFTTRYTFWSIVVSSKAAVIKIERTQNQDLKPADAVALPHRTASPQSSFTLHAFEQRVRNPPRTRIWPCSVRSTASAYDHPPANLQEANDPGEPRRVQQINLLHGSIALVSGQAVRKLAEKGQPPKAKRIDRRRWK